MSHVQGDRNRQVERRNLISSVFIGLLIALAYSEAVAPVRQSVRAHGFTLATSMLFLIFFLTTMRFFIGAQLHLLSPDLVTMPGHVWFFDFMVITIEALLFAFMGGVSSLEESLRSPVGFVALLIVVLVIDIAWVSTQWVLAALFPSFRRQSIPWAWAILNASLIAAMLLPRLFVGTFYSDQMLIWVAAANAVAFIVDVVLVDYHDLI